MYFHALPVTDMDGKAHALAMVQRLATEEQKSRKLLVPFDGSPAARCALEYAVDLARKERSDIHLVNVQKALIDDAVFYRAHQKVGEHILKAATDHLEPLDVRFTSEVALGFPAQAIVRTAGLERCDLIVMGSRGKSGIASFLSASVSRQVVRLARIPVTVIKREVTATTHSPQSVSVTKWRPES